MEFILTFLVVFFVLSWILAKLFPRLLSWWLKKKIDKMGNGFGGFSSGGARWQDIRGQQEEQIRREKEQEGKITVYRVEETEKIIEDDMGEYIDFEEESEQIQENHKTDIKTN